MSWQEKLASECPDEALGRKVTNALEDLFLIDKQLFEVDAHERTICSRLANHLSQKFKEWDVDTEYNKNGINPKKIGIGEEDVLVYPDIIIHKRQTNRNLLVLEIKKGDSAAPDSFDMEKLRSFRIQYDYQLSLFVRLSSKNFSVSSFRWVVD